MSPESNTNLQDAFRVGCSLKFVVIDPCFYGLFAGFVILERGCLEERLFMALRGLGCSLSVIEKGWGHDIG